MSALTAPVLAAVAAVAELDASSFGQFMVSRPLVLGPILGGAAGDAWRGACVGALCETFSLGDLPVGGKLPLNATVAAAAAILLSFGPEPLPLPASFPCGLLLGWAHAAIESALRRRRAGFGGLVESALASGTEAPLGRLVMRELMRQGTMTFAVLLGALALREPLLYAWDGVPEAARAGLRAGLVAAPCIGAASLLRALGGSWRRAR